MRISIPFNKILKAHFTVVFLAAALIASPAMSQNSETLDIYEFRACNALDDLNQKRHCLIELRGYTRETCDVMHTSKSYSLCFADHDKYHASLTECQKNFSCHWESNVKPVLVKISKILEGINDNPYVTSVTRTPDLGKESDWKPLFWAEPGRGTIVVEVKNSRKYEINPSEKNRGVVKLPSGNRIILEPGIGIMEPYDPTR